MRAATAAQIRDAIARFGAHQVVEALWGHETDEGWARVAGKIVSGQQEWLDLAPLLRPGTDAGSSEELAIVIADALPHNPAGVLKLIGTDAGVDLRGVCSFQEIEAPRADAVRFYASAIPAVEGIRDPSLAALKQQCLALLQEARARDLTGPAQ